MATLERALVIAAEAHAGMTDKGGAPYILHPLRLMHQMTTADERIVALLHDVVEDSPWTLEALRAEGFSENVVAAVDGLTRREGEPYEDFIARGAANPLARRVKLADIEDNLDLRRLGELEEKDLARLQRYQRARRVILAAIAGE
ncbi:MAG: HD domain-containing protein [Candidatus Hydrogenedentes bacterium]|nr:HD domain-containing protein [Candidatus Hydrogenedentota bacterium]